LQLVTKEAVQTAEQTALRDAINEALAQNLRRLDELGDGAALQDSEKNLGRAPGRKTLASNLGGDKTISGWTPKDGFVQATDEVMEKAEEIGHELRSHPFDRGVDGRYFASHAEKQAALTSRNIAVSKIMCADCQEYFRRLAIYSGDEYTVLDPKALRVFNPDGTVSFTPR
jgi:hypothetical protein